MKPRLRWCGFEWSCRSEHDAGSFAVGYGSTPFLAFINWHTCVVKLPRLFVDGSNVTRIDDPNEALRRRSREEVDAWIDDDRRRALDRLRLVR